MKSDFLVALTQLAAERNLPREIVLSAIEAALVSAYRKDSIMDGQNISVKLDPGTGEVSVFVVKTVVEEVADSQQEISLGDAKKLKPEAQIGAVIPTESLPHSAGRIAAQTAKQVVMQRLREAERELVYAEFAEKEGEVFSVTVQRIEPKQIVIEMGRAEAILPMSEQSPGERYRVGMKMKVILQSVRRSTKGPELIVSRADNKLLFRLFEMEIPEIFNGAVEIMAIAREPGARSKVAVFAKQEGVDPVGSCVGLRGIRIQNIVNEVHGEKIDVVQWHKDPATFIASALSPSQVLRVDLDPETGTAVAVVPDRQLSLAIGKEGQNARLAARLAGWKIDIRSHLEVEAGGAPAEVKQAAAVAPVVKPAEEKKLKGAAPAQAAAQVETAATEAVEIEEEAAPSAAEGEAPEVVAAEGPVSAEAEEAPQGDVVEPMLPEELFDLGEGPGEEEAQELVPALQSTAASLVDLPEDVWSLRRSGAPPEPGQIRFAEDIVGLKGGVMARRGRKGGVPLDGPPRDRKRKAGAGKKRRF